MEVNVTKFVVENAKNMMDFSASVMELGHNAGKITWEASKDSVEDWKHLDTEEKLQAARDHFLEYGAWTEQEINDWTDTELNAIVNQEIAASYREFEPYETVEEMSKAIENGQVSGRLSCSDNGKEWFFYLGM